MLVIMRTSRPRSEANRPVLDMTADGEFRSDPPPSGGAGWGRQAAGNATSVKASGLDGALAKLGGVAFLVAVGTVGLALAALAFTLFTLLIPVAVAAGLIGLFSLWWRGRRRGQGFRFVAPRR